MKFLLSAAVLLAVATPAMAQDEQSTFAGPYVGAYVGLDHFRIKDDASGESGSREGVAFGAMLGYNVDLGGAVVGIEGEWGDTSTSADAPDLFVTGDNLKLSANRDLFIGGRLGIKASPDMLVYAKGGYANTRMTLQYASPGNPVEEASDTIDGFRLGGGFEFAASERVSFRMEYRYSDYAEFEYLNTPTGLHANRHQVIVGAIGRF